MSAERVNNVFLSRSCISCVTVSMLDGEAVSCRLQMKRSEVSRGVRSHSAGAFDLQRLAVVSQEQTEGGAVEEQLLGERRRSLEGDVDWLLPVMDVTNQMPSVRDRRREAAASHILKSIIGDL